MRMLNPSGTRKGKKRSPFVLGVGRSSHPHLCRSAHSLRRALSSCHGADTPHDHWLQRRASVVGAVPGCYLCAHRTAGASTLKKSDFPLSVVATRLGCQHWGGRGQPGVW